MDPVLNPFAPGAGTLPPELAGREEVRETVRVALERVRRGAPTKSILLVGLRGVGKTVLLTRMRLDAEANGFETIDIEAPEGRSLPALLAPQLRQILLRLSRDSRARDLALRGLRALAGFVRTFKVRYQDIEVGLDLDPEPGLADNGDLEQDLQTLLLAAGEAARQAETALVLFIDELQYVEEEQLGALIMTLHSANQRQVPIALIGAGLPQLRGLVGDAKSYSERLFDFQTIGALPEEAAKAAIAKPIAASSAAIDEDALSDIVSQTKGYPYFLQEWGKHSWDAAAKSPIRLEDVRAAAKNAVAALDDSFFRIRFDRLTPAEKRYLRAMAELGPGPHRSGDVAARLNRRVTAVAPVRNRLIAKGMIYSPTHGDTAFTVPLFDEFMRRIMPDADEF